MDHPPNNDENQPGVEERLAALEAENQSLRKQLQAAQQRIAELEGGAPASAGFDVKTDEHAVPFAEEDAAAPRSTVEVPPAELEPNEERIEAFDKPWDDGTKSGPRRLEPLEAAEPVAQPVVVGESPEKVERKRTLAFVAAVLGVVVVAAAVVAIMIYRSAAFTEVATPLPEPPAEIEAPVEAPATAVATEDGAAEGSPAPTPLEEEEQQQQPAPAPEVAEAAPPAKSPEPKATKPKKKPKSTKKNRKPKRSRKSSKKKPPVVVISPGG